MPTTHSIDLIILAAGKGTRLKSEQPKVLHSLLGQPLLGHVLNAFKGTPIRKAYVVVGHGRDQVIDYLEKHQAHYPFPLQVVIQDPPNGTGDAVEQVLNLPASDQPTGSVVIVSGDTPLLQGATLNSFVTLHQQQQNKLTLMAAQLPNPGSYGRVIVPHDKHSPITLVEAKDATPEQAQINLVNAGLYCIDWPTISPLLKQLGTQNAQGEKYLTDIVRMAGEAGHTVGVAQLDDPQEMLGVNQRQDLAQCTQVLSWRKIQSLMDGGVTFVDPFHTVISPEVAIGPDTTIYPGCVLEGNITIGEGCTIGPHSTFQGKVTLGNRVTVLHSVLRDAQVGDDSQVGPFAHLRDEAILSHHVRVGNFVEVKNTKIDHHTNAAHLSYLGDATLGTDVNIGAGTIVANYDPIKDLKTHTTIEDGAKVGCNSVLVSPVTIAERSCVAAGSVITESTEPYELAIARARQTGVKEWVKRFLSKTPV